MKIRFAALIIGLALVVAPLAGGLIGPSEAIGLNQARLAPRVPTAKLAYSPWRTAPLEVALVFGRATWTACSNADPELIQDTAEAAINANLDPSIAAATVAVESSCNRLALSGKAVGYMQIKPDAHPEYDFSKVNLLNRRDNLRVGSEIMADSIDRNGLVVGVQRYNGAGVGCATCDAGYSSKILSLARK